MSKNNNIEEKLYTPEQLQKLNSLRSYNELERFQKNMSIHKKQYALKKHILKEEDKISSKFIAGKIDHKGKGVIIKVKKKGLSFDVKFGRYIIEGVPQNYINYSPTQELRGVDIEYWQQHFREYVELKVKYHEMNTRQLLVEYRERLRGNDLNNPHTIEMKRELATRGHIPRKSDRSHRGKIERIKWEEFLNKK